MAVATPMTLVEVAPVTQDENSMVVWVSVLIGLALLPFLLTMVTSFAKFAIVGGLLRQAMGTPQIPPTSVITGLAMILSLHVMSPVIDAAYTRYRTHEGAFDSGVLFDAIHEPLLGFLQANTSQSDHELFLAMSRTTNTSENESGSEPGQATTAEDDRLAKAKDLLTVAAPAFVLTELAEAFLIGVYLFIPFLVIDLVVSNVLLAMGMHMLTPLTISLPLKVLLFVCIDGWSLVLHGVVSGYSH